MTDPTVQICTIASGSGGNSVYLRFGEDEILIDAGISCRRITDGLKALGTSPENLRAVFITHEHSDHICGLETLLKKWPIPLHMVEASAKNGFASGKYPHAAAGVITHPPLFCVQIGNLTVRSFATPHDAAASVGYVIKDGNPDHTTAVATDIGHITPDIEEALTGVPNLILESNHNEAMLLCGSYPYELKRRILSDRGHLSNDCAAVFLKRLADAGARRVLLAHLSKENNLPDLALATAMEALEGCNIRVAVAAPSEITVLPGASELC